MADHGVTTMEFLEGLLVANEPQELGFMAYPEEPQKLTEVEPVDPCQDLAIVVVKYSLSNYPNIESLNGQRLRQVVGFATVDGFLKYHAQLDVELYPYRKRHESTNRSGHVIGTIVSEFSLRQPINGDGEPWVPVYDPRRV